MRRREEVVDIRPMEARNLPRVDLFVEAGNYRHPMNPYLFLGRWLAGWPAMQCIAYEADTPKTHSNGRLEHHYFRRSEGLCYF